MINLKIKSTVKHRFFFLFPNRYTLFYANNERNVYNKQISIQSLPPS